MVHLAAARQNLSRKPVLGVLMLQTNFERIPGDIGNPATFTYPVLYRAVPGASISRVVDAADPELITPFIAAGLKLVEAGATHLATSCGFLAIFQQEIQAGLPVPFASSALLQLHAASRHGPVGVITARASALSKEHFAGVGEDKPLAVAGMEDSVAFASAILEQSAPLDPAQINFEVREVTQKLLSNHPNLRALVLECTNLSPYADAVRQLSGLPVYDSTTLCEDLLKT